MLDSLIQFDIKCFLFLNGFHSPFWDAVMWHISATKTWIPLYVLILFFVFKKLRYEGLIAMFFMVLLVVLADQGSVELFKKVFERLRPCHNPEISHLVHTVNSKCGGQFGFVSSHAANTFALAVFSAFFFKNRKITILILLWAAIVSYSRIYLGVHYLFDVIGGALLGSFIGFITYRLYLFTIYKFRQRKKPAKAG